MPRRSSHRSFVASYPLNIFPVQTAAPGPGARHAAQQHARRRHAPPSQQAWKCVHACASAWGARGAHIHRPLGTQGRSGRAGPRGPWHAASSGPQAHASRHRSHSHARRSHADPACVSGTPAHAPTAAHGWGPTARAPTPHRPHPPRAQAPTHARVSLRGPRAPSAAHRARAHTASWAQAPETAQSAAAPHALGRRGAQMPRQTARGPIATQRARPMMRTLPRPLRPLRPRPPLRPPARAEHGATPGRVLRAVVAFHAAPHVH